MVAPPDAVPTPGNIITTRAVHAARGAQTETRDLTTAFRDGVTLAAQEWVTLAEIPGVHAKQ
jgi:hypothetical protein